MKKVCSIILGISLGLAQVSAAGFTDSVKTGFTTAKDFTCNHKVALGATAATVAATVFVYKNRKNEKIACMLKTVKEQLKLTVTCPKRRKIVAISIVAGVIAGGSYDYFLNDKKIFNKLTRNYFVAPVVEEENNA